MPLLTVPAPYSAWVRYRRKRSMDPLTFANWLDLEIEEVNLGATVPVLSCSLPVEGRARAVSVRQYADGFLTEMLHQERGDQLLIDDLIDSLAGYAPLTFTAFGSLSYDDSKINVDSRYQLEGRLPLPGEVDTIWEQHYGKEFVEPAVRSFFEDVVSIDGLAWRRVPEPVLVLDERGPRPVIRLSDRVPANLKAWRADSLKAGSEMLKGDPALGFDDLLVESPSVLHVMDEAFDIVRAAKALVEKISYAEIAEVLLLDAALGKLDLTKPSSYTESSILPIAEALEEAIKRIPPSALSKAGRDALEAFDMRPLSATPLHP